MRFFSLFSLSLGLTSAATLSASNINCNRKCMANMVTEILDSMVAHNPYTLPMAPVYKATENSHPAALGMMTAWRTITATCEPSLLAIDVKNGTAYFAVDISEGNDAVKNILRGRVAVVNRTITELELFINRYRGDHGFSFSAAELPTNYATLMSPPANRTKASRKKLMELSADLFAERNSTYDVADSCQFSELGWRVVDPGTNDNGSFVPLGCSWPAFHPTDPNARVGLVVDEELGFVVTSAIIPGRVYAYSNISAFIPNTISFAQEAQEEWFQIILAQGTMPLLADFGATGDVLEVLQCYDGALQAEQINVYLNGPNMTSPWLS